MSPGSRLDCSERAHLHRDIDAFEPEAFRISPLRLVSEQGIYLVSFARRLTELTNVRAEYFGLDVAGPYKPERYRFVRARPARS